jgi:hypothetical protein
VYHRAVANRWPLARRLEARVALASSTGAALVGRYAELRRRLAALHERWRWRDPRCLTRFEARRSSENGEDGILREIFRRLDGDRGGARSFVEFGVADGSECCTRALLDDGFTGVWIEAQPKAAEQARAAFASRSLTVLERRLTVDNLPGAFDEARVGRELDLLVVDVDGNDYWLLEAALDRCAPRVLAVEYNAGLGARADWIMPYSPAHRFDGSGWFGASLRALTRLADRHGLALVGCDSHGVNAFFVRRALLDARRWVRPGDVAFHFATVKFHPNLVFGDPDFFPDEPETQLIGGADLARVDVRLARPAPHEVARGQRFTLALRVHNTAPSTLKTHAPHPVFATYRWRDQAGAIVQEQPRLSRILPRVDPGATRIIRIAVTAPSRPGPCSLTATFIQTGGVRLAEVELPREPHARIHVR